MPWIRSALAIRDSGFDWRSNDQERTNTSRGRERRQTREEEVHFKRKRGGEGGKKGEGYYTSEKISKITHNKCSEIIKAILR